MAAMMKSMSSEHAWKVLEKSNMSASSLVEVKSEMLGKQNNLRKQPKGYAGLAGARKLLNDMIYESMSKPMSGFPFITFGYLSLTKNSLLVCILSSLLSVRYVFLVWEPATFGDSWIACILILGRISQQS